ncbi:MAG: roadblock/LC7 domain-containing protein [Planctomycetes bacterium]|jgi:predicted regulator of Ras-like GTPase activity (Roadblock/LC7/MglB family)|nr:roadblock/LC7 domain-containing protein [Planctomycetota bacterium]
MSKTNETIRLDRLVFYKNDIDRFDRILRDFINLSKAKCALLVDREGHMITKQGVTRFVDIDSIAALVAGAFAATKEMARLLGEDEFSILFHQGKTDSIQLSLIGDRALLTTIFDDSTTVGMVRLYANEASKSLLKCFRRADRAQAEGTVEVGPAEQMSSDFSADAKTALDDILG